MKKLMFSTAAILALSLSAFAGTPETKGEAKTTAKTQDTYVYHYVSTNTDGTLNFLPGEPNPSACEGAKEIPCRWTSDEELTSPMLPSEIEGQATVTDRRPSEN